MPTDLKAEQCQFTGGNAGITADERLHPFLHDFNYHSWNIALNSGFRPAWVEIGSQAAVPKGGIS